MFDFFVAWRFLREGRGQTLLVIAGITLGIAVQIFLNSLIVGLQKDLVRKTVGTAPHIVASMPDPVPSSGLAARGGEFVLSRIVTSEGSTKPIRGWPPIEAQLRKTGAISVVNPVAEGSGFISQGQKSLPVLLRGLDLDRADALYRIRSRMIAGRFAVGAEQILVGRALSEKLRIGVGGMLRIAIPGGGGELFTVSGIFDLESQVINETWVILALPRAQILLGFDHGVSTIEMQVSDVFAAEDQARQLRLIFPRLKWVSWQESNASLLAALKSQSSSSYLIQVFVLLAVTLGIASVLAVSAAQKTRQIGILKAMGAQTRAIGRIFLIQGATLGVAGSLLGGLVGVALIEGFSAAASGSGRLFPIRLEMGAFLVSVTIATLAGTLAALFPARRAARMSPIDVIRNG